MACFIPFDSKNLDISFFTFRPTIVIVDDLVESLKHFSFSAENLGCLHSAIFRSIHGSMIIWYGAWLKRSNEKKELLNTALLSLLDDVSTMSILMDHYFFDAYAGASTYGSQAAKFFNGDIISMYSASHSSDDIKEKVSYAALAIFKSNFLKMSGSKSGVCLRSQSNPKIIGLCVWKSLEYCYSYILSSDYRKTILPYLDGLPLVIKYDVYRVVYVSGENVAHSAESYSYFRMVENEVDGEVFEVMPDIKSIIG